MTSEPVRDPLADHLLTPQNCDYTGHTRGQATLTRPERGEPGPAPPSYPQTA